MTALKNHVSNEPPATFTFVIVMGAPPAGEVLVKVTTAVPLSVPPGSVIVSGFGVTDAVPRATPVPLRSTGEPLIVALDVIVRVAETSPLAFGENTTLMVQLPVAGVSVAPHVPPAVPADLA